MPEPRLGLSRLFSTTATACLAIASVIGSVLLAGASPSGSSDGPQSYVHPPAAPREASPAGTPVRSETALSSTSMTSSSRSIQIRWRATDEATLYNVILFREGERTDLWPERNSVDLFDVAAKTTERPVPAGTYLWFAYPGFRKDDRVRYGGLIAHGSVRIPAG